MHRRAFTLVELLVVVSIIALLIAILLPALNKARAAARTILCATQQRSIGAAMFFYNDANVGAYPYAYRSFPEEKAPWSPVGGSLISYDDLLGAFDGRNMKRDAMLERWLRDVPGGAHAFKANGLYQCPGRAAPGGYRRDYGINGGAWGVNKNTPGIASGPYSVRLIDVALPAWTFALGESDVSVLGSNLRGAVVTSPFNQEGMGIIGWGPYAPFHVDNTRWNYLFCDGHVELLDPEITIGIGNRGGPPRDDDGAKGMWTRDPND